MKSWYKISQVRQYQFDNQENIFYKIIEKESPFDENDMIKVYHAFRSINDAIITAEYGLSGKYKVPRLYSYESNNNPQGLFVTTNFKTATEFTTYGAIMEFNCKFSELEVPVWPSGGYTVQGQMAEYWDWDNIDEQRQEAINKRREEAKQSEFEAIRKSSRPELAESLMTPSEYQALFTGDLNPQKIIQFWIRDSKGEVPLISDPWKPLSREEFLGQEKYQMSKTMSGEEIMEESHRDIKGKLFGPEDDFSSEKFLSMMNTIYPSSNIIDIIKEINDEEEMFEIFKKDVWPRQYDGLKNMIRDVLKNQQ